MSEPDWELTEDEAAAVDKAFEHRNGLTIPAKPCPVRFEIKDAERLPGFMALVDKYVLPPGEFFYRRAMERSAEIKKQFYESNPSINDAADFEPGGSPT